MAGAVSRAKDAGHATRRSDEVRREGHGAALLGDGDGDRSGITGSVGAVTGVVGVDVVGSTGKAVDAGVDGSGGKRIDLGCSGGRVRGGDDADVTGGSPAAGGYLDRSDLLRPVRGASGSERERRGGGVEGDGLPVVGQVGDVDRAKPAGRVVADAGVEADSRSAGGGGGYGDGAGDDVLKVAARSGQGDGGVGGECR